MKFIMIMMLPFFLLAQEHIIVEAKDAKVINPYESRLIGDSLEFWNNSETCLEWTIQSPRDLELEIQLFQAFIDSNTANFIFKIGDKEINSEVLNTNSWSQFKYNNLGKIKISKGIHIIKIIPINKPGIAIMNLKHIKFSGHDIQGLNLKSQKGKSNIQAPQKTKYKYI